MTWRSRLGSLFRRKPATARSFTACPQCGDKMIFVEKYTMGGDDLRTYRCDRCQSEHTLDFGPALWTYMSGADKP
jgi:transposase-like protein